MLDQFLESADIERIKKREQARIRELVMTPRWEEVRALQEKISGNHEAQYEILLKEAIELRAGALSAQTEIIEKLIHTLIPWRTGPYKINEFFIDSEWQSNLKWNRIAPVLKNIVKGQKVLDLGCNSGYFMYRLLEFNPELIIGFDTSERCYQQFKFLNTLSRIPNLIFKLLGVDDLLLFDSFFDTTLCLGVIYHRRDPYTTLGNIRKALKPGGRLILESLTIRGDEPLSFSPPDRYLKMRNTWFVPTIKCLKAWLNKMGYTDIKLISVDELSTIEQRQTPLAPYESLKDFLDPNESSLTIEGFPAPQRTILQAISA